MARIGIVSIFDLGNVGNRLQSYALHQVLQELGHQPVVIPNEAYPVACDEGLAEEFGLELRPPHAHRRKHRWAPDALRWIPRSSWGALRSRDPHVFASGLAGSRRRTALRRFSRRNMEIAPVSIDSPLDGEGLAERFDAFVAGSDQIWNPRYRYACPTDFLTFARPEQRIAYAASIGVTTLDDVTARVYGKFLSEMPSVSVREDSAADLVEELIGERPPVLLDPTLLLDRQHWSGLADRAPAPKPGSFMSSYLLYRNGPEVREAIGATAAASSFEHHDIIVPRRLGKARVGLEAFLRGIRDAEYVVTDSFHATVFSMIFNKPVLVLSRGQSQDARVRTLLQHLGISPEHVFGEPSDRPADALGHDPSRLVSLASASREWLSNAIDLALGKGAA